MAADDVRLYFGFYVFLLLWELQHCTAISSVSPVRELFKAAAGLFIAVSLITEEISNRGGTWKCC